MVKISRQSLLVGIAIAVLLVSAGLWYQRSKGTNSYASVSSQASAQGEADHKARTNDSSKRQSSGSTPQRTQESSPSQWESGKTSSRGTFTLVGSLADVSIDKAAIILGNNSKVSFSLDLMASPRGSEKSPSNLSGKKVEVTINVMSDGTFSARRIEEIK